MVGMGGFGMGRSMLNSMLSGMARGMLCGIGVPMLCLASLPILLASMWIYRKDGFYFAGGGIELPVLWAGAQVAQVFLGAGAFRSPLPGWLPFALRILL
jgi:hypothetical protein